jgi:hypothetical protein
MFKYWSVVILFFMVGCSSIPDVALPSIPGGPFMGNNPNGPEAGALPDPDDSSATVAVAQLEGYQSRGNGYLSFTYDRGHLEKITVKLGGDQIPLSKGQTIIRKLPVGNYSFDVSGKQLESRRYRGLLNYDGDTDEFIFDIPTRYSEIGDRQISTRDLEHNLGVLIVASSLVSPLVEVTRLDAPQNVLLLGCYLEEEAKSIKVGDTVAGNVDGNSTRGKITKIVTYKDLSGSVLEKCAYSDNVTYSSPLRMSVPEGRYWLTASGKSEELYVRDKSFNTIEIIYNGFEVSTKVD